ncbi:MAG: TRAP transporter large permease subunit [Rhizobiaceae bacterium]|nr:TRAP transporter large permease subunit [Rhizobiaceae bacterium]
MEIIFLLLLIVLMAGALASGYPVAFALPGSAILTVLIAAICGYLFAGNTDAYFAQGGPGQWLSAGVTNLRGIYWEPERDTLIAIPLFVFMGIMLQRSRIAEDLLIAMAQLFGPIPGGLGISVVFVGALLAATTGIVGATVVAMGLISLPAMLRNNYSQPLATGTIAASGTLGQIIPPSIVLIILADQLASASDQAGTARTALYKQATGELTMPSAFNVAPTSAGEMFLGAFIPGLVLVALYMIFILVRALINPKVAPAVPYEGKYDAAFAGKVLLALVPPLALIFVVLGSIIGGVATVNQAGAIGAAGALIMAGYKLKDGGSRAYYPAIIAVVSLVLMALIRSQFDVNIKGIDDTHDAIGVTLMVLALGLLVFALLWSGWRAIRIDNTMYGVMIETAKTTSLVFIILLGAAMLTAAFRAFGGEEIVREFLTGLPGGFWMQFFIVMAVIFVLGFFLDFIEIAVVVVPIVAPILLADPGANVTAVWLGVMIGLNIQTSFLTPPFGFALFYLRGVAPAIVKTIQIYKGVIAFIILQLVALVIVAYAPPLVNYLPSRVALLSETSPPPRNPSLQYCVDRYVFDTLENRGDTIRAQLAAAEALNLAVLPERYQNRLGDAFTSANDVFGLVEKVHEAEAAVAAATPAYRPLHSAVRAIERDVRRHEDEISELQTRISRLRGDDSEIVERRERLMARVEVLEAEKNALLAEIPAEWDATHDEFAKLTRAETQAGNAYRRAADNSYGAVNDVAALLADAGKLAALRASLAEVDIQGGDPAELVDRLTDLQNEADATAGASDVRSGISNARRAFEGETPDRGTAAEEVAEALAAADEELAWRQPASAELMPTLGTYADTIRTNLGLRQLQRFPREQALYVASCNASHRDVSLNF